MFNIFLASNFSTVEYQNSFFIIGIVGVVVFIFWLLSRTNLKQEVIPYQVNLTNPGLTKNVDVVLTQYFTYYVALDKQLKKEFVKRVKVFVSIKKFIPRQTKYNEIIIILIAATAIQLTFGLKDFSIYYFDKILIYPSSYYSQIRNTYHQGEVNVYQKLIVLSAKHFLEGISNANDGIHLGLHEFAHALHIHTHENRAIDFLFNFEQWAALADVEMLRVDNNSTHFLRKYAATNINEMFAICTEKFFEQPEMFKNELPKLYDKMTILYNQNPLNRKFPLSI